MAREESRGRDRRGRVPLGEPGSPVHWRNPRAPQRNAAPLRRKEYIRRRQARARQLRMLLAMRGGVAMKKLAFFVLFAGLAGPFAYADGYKYRQGSDWSGFYIRAGVGEYFGHADWSGSG